MAKIISFGEREFRSRVLQQIFATGSQVTRWSVKSNDVGQVSQFTCCQDFKTSKGCNGDLELNSTFDRKPMKIG